MWVNFQLELRHERRGFFFKNLYLDDPPSQGRGVRAIRQELKDEWDFLAATQMDCVVSSDEGIGGGRGWEAVLLAEVLPLFWLAHQLEHSVVDFYVEVCVFDHRVA